MNESERADRNDVSLSRSQQHLVQEPWLDFQVVHVHHATKSHLLQGHAATQDASCRLKELLNAGWSGLLGARSLLTAQSLAYGKCIGANYLEVSKGMCSEEFAAFKECVTVSGLSHNQSRR